MQTRKVNIDGRGNWLSPWFVIVFTVGAVVGALLGPRYGPIYTSVGIVITGWLVALLLVASDRRIPLPRIGSKVRRPGPSRMGADAGAAGKAAQIRRGSARGTQSNNDLRRARLRPIAGGKNEPH